jgi:hypothetical protein
MARRGTRDRVKERLWRCMLGQWRRSGQSIRACCSRQGLDEPLFYAWRRTIAQRDQLRRQRPRLRLTDQVDRPADDPKSDTPPVFVPVHVLPASPALEVVLGSGRVLRVPSGFDPATLRQVLASLQETPPC